MRRNQIDRKKLPTLAKETLRRLDQLTLSDKELAGVGGGGKWEGYKWSGRCTL